MKALYISVVMYGKTRSGAVLLIFMNFYETAQERLQEAEN